MKKTKFLAASCFLACSLLAVAAERSTLMTPAEMNNTIGADTAGWCYEAEECNAVASSCNADDTCVDVGDKCGKKRVLEYNEICSPEFGNEHCRTDAAQDVEVLCYTEWTCLCDPDVGNGIECNPTEGEAAPNTAPIFKTATISVDTTSCAYVENSTP